MPPGRTRSRTPETVTEALDVSRKLRIPFQLILHLPDGVQHGRVVPPTETLAANHDRCLSAGEDAGRRWYRVAGLEHLLGYAAVQKGRLTSVAFQHRGQNQGRVTDSCGFGVPRMAFEQDRTQLPAYAERKGLEGIEQYKAANNACSLDGLPGLERT